jgi:hypothetical protein
MTIPDSAPCRPPGTVALTVTTTCELTGVAATGDLDNAVAGRLRECLAGEVLPDIAAAEDWLTVVASGAVNSEQIP